MTTSLPLRIMMITRTDMDSAWNNREHNMMRAFASAGCDVAVVHLALNRSKAPLYLLRDTVTCSMKRSKEGGVDFVRVDPFFNYYGGLRRNAEAATEPGSLQTDWRSRALQILSPLSCLRDLFLWPCFVAGALVRLKGRYDAAVGFGPWGSLVGWTLRCLGKVRIFIYEDRDYEPGLLPHGLRRRYTAWLERSMSRRADLVVSIGRRLQALRTMQSGREVHHVSTGVDWARFAPARDRTPGGRTLVYVGNLETWSGLDVAIRAMPQILQAFPDARLRIVGSGLPANRMRLEGLVEDLDLGGSVDFLGSRANDELPELLAEARIGLANSEPVRYRQYARPLKVVEYMAAGRPSIVTKDTEAADMVDRYGCGVAAEYSPEAFAEAANRLLGDEELYARQRGNAIEHSARFDWMQLMVQELNLIRQALSEESDRADGEENGRRAARGRTLRIGVDARTLLRPRTGVERMAFHFMRNLDEAGLDHDYVLFLDQAIDPPPWLGTSCRIEVVPVRFPRLQKLFDGWLAVQLRGPLKRLGIDAFYAPHTKFPFAAIPRYTTVHGLEWHFYPSGYRRIEKIKQWVWFRLATARSAGIFTFTNHTLEDIRKLRPNCRPPIWIVREGVDPIFRRLDSDERRPEEIEKLGIGKPFILSVCSLEPRKNLDSLLRAYRMVLQEHRIEHQLVLVGQPKWRWERLLDQVKALDLHDRVVFTGYVTDEQLVQLYNQAALFTYPSKYEGFGLPVLEAMACGVPVITSSVSSLKEVAGDAAMLIDPYSDRELATAIARGLTDEKLREGLTRAGFEQAATYSWQGMTRAICERMNDGHGA